MDEIDKQILLYIFKNPDISQRDIAKELGLSPPSLNYRIKKLQEDGIFLGYTVLVNPNFYGKYFGFVAFKNYYDFYGEGVFFKFKCLEWLNVYGVEGNSFHDIEDKMYRMSKILGEPSMKYFPKQEPVQPKDYDFKIVSQLVKNPKAQISDIVQETGLPQRLVSKRLETLFKKGYVKLLPIVNLKNSDLVMFSMFTRNVKDVRKILESCKILEITDGDSGILVCIEFSFERAKKYIDSVRNFADKNADVMIIYDYEIFTPYFFNNK
ncbi:winged helix-turn-helix domain-containing protein [Sulfolobaceae archaeon RB850M]|jgi:DNA-binding Lrp family transcriptional regulator